MENDINTQIIFSLKGNSILCVVDNESNDKTKRKQFNRMPPKGSEFYEKATIAQLKLRNFEPCLEDINMRHSNLSEFKFSIVEDDVIFYSFNNKFIHAFFISDNFHIVMNCAKKTFTLMNDSNAKVEAAFEDILVHSDDAISSKVLQFFKCIDKIHLFF